MTTLRAYHNQQSIKDTYITRVQAHRAADELIKGVYRDDEYAGVWRGCAVGCTLHSDDHDAYETELGIPRQLALLEDAIFEGLPEPKHLEWPERFLSVIQVGADLSVVHHQFTVWLLLDEQHGVIRFLETDEERALMRRIANLHERSMEGNRPSEDEWDAAWAAAWAAARDAAWDAAWAAAWAAHYVVMADKLIEFLQAAPVPVPAEA